MEDADGGKSIARAVYARRKLAIFDDIFSGLDTVTADFVFSNIFGNQGLLREMHATVILVTHDCMPILCLPTYLKC